MLSWNGEETDLLNVDQRKKERKKERYGKKKNKKKSLSSTINTINGKN